MSADDLYSQAFEKVGNRFLLTILLAKRAAQLKKGAEPLVPADAVSTEEIVLREIVEGKLSWRAEAPAPVAGEGGESFEPSFEEEGVEEL
ncbi:MAG: DNA-directed RNA polymerase subunit omega [Nitrospinota bacterium]